MTSPVYVSVHVYTAQGTICKVPENAGLCLTGHPVLQGERMKHEKVIVIKNLFDPLEFDRDPGRVAK